MSKQFFITGLPRSRTAWFANLFTWGDSICYHDELRWDPTIGRLTHLLRDIPNVCGVKRGHSCASNLLAWRELSVEFPDAKWVLVHRSVDDVFESCRNILPSTNYDSLLTMKEALLGIGLKLNHIDVSFDRITPSLCYSISEYLGVDIGPEARVRQLCDMNIQIHPPILRERLTRLSQQAA